MARVRRHTRRLKSGKLVTVRAHNRRTRAKITLGGVLAVVIIVIIIVAALKGG